MHGGFWTGLSSAAEMECDHGRMGELDSEFILDTFTWYSKGLSSEKFAVGPDSYPDL